VVRFYFDANAALEMGEAHRRRGLHGAAGDLHRVREVELRHGPSD
jgi:hypothetical protein